MKCMKKSLFKLVMGLVCFLNIHAVKQIKPNVYCGSHYTPYHATLLVDYVIAWDLNNVVFTNKYGAKDIISGAVQQKGYVGGFKALLTLVTFKNTINAERKKNNLAPCKWEHIMYHLLRLNNSEAVFLARFLQSILEVPDRIDKNVAKIMTDLKKYSCKQGVLSNMWAENLALQIAHLNKKGDRYADVIKILEDTAVRAIPTEENNWIHKTERAAYEAFLEKIVPQRYTISIFIDDNPENIQAALESGLFDIGIVFTTAQELRSTLQEIGVFEDSQRVQDGIPVEALA